MYYLEHVIKPIDDSTVSASILCDTTPETDSIALEATDVQGLNYNMGQGSILRTPGADFVAFAPPVDGVTTFKKKLSSGGGGGNPNSKVVIEGTLDDPFGSIEDFDLLARALSSGNVSAIIVIDASALGMEIYTQALIGHVVSGLILTSGASITADTSAANEVLWNDTNGSLLWASIEINGSITDMRPYASMITTTLTIWTHPMPLG